MSKSQFFSVATVALVAAAAAIVVKRNGGPVKSIDKVKRLAAVSANTSIFAALRERFAIGNDNDRIAEDSVRHGC